MLFRKKLNSAPWMVLALASSLLLLTACVPGGETKEECNKSGKGSFLGLGSDKEDSKKGKDKCHNEPSPSPSPTASPSPIAMPTLPGRSCVVDRFKQSSGEEVVKKLDMLFVMDHSGSMADDWARVANNVQNLVKELPSTVDIRYAVLLANGAAWKGRLYAPVKTPTIQNNQTMKVQEITNNLHKIFTEGMKVSDNSGSGEASFLSLHSAVTTNAKDNQRIGFFRPDAALSILFMSDEQEIGFPFPNPQAPGLPSRCDAAFEDNVKKTLYDSKGINLDLAFNATKALKGDMPVVTHAFVNITKEDLFTRNSKNSSCLYDSLGYGYFEMVEKTKGVLFSIQADKAEGMARCGRVIKERLSLVHDFPLSKPADQVDAATILAHVDGLAVAHEYRVAANSVHLDNAGIAESDVEIRHCAPISRPDWTLQNFTGQASQYGAALSWKTPEYATRGKILYGTSEVALTLEASDNGSAVTDHVVNVTGLTPNRVYYFQAVASDEFGLEKKSAVISLRTQPDWSLTGLKGEPSRNTVNISWDTSEYPTIGRVKYGISADALVNTSEESASANGHDLQISALSPNTVYYFQPVSRDEYGLEKNGDVISVRTLSDWGLVGFRGDAARFSVSLQWQTPGYSTTSRVIYGLSAGALTSSESSVATGTEHTATVNGLSPGTLYYFQAVAVDNLGVEKRSEVLQIRTLVDWNISNFIGTSEQTSVSVSWSTVEYATSGKVIWGSTAEAMTGQVATAGPAADHSATVTGLSADTLYYFQAVSTDENGLTKASAVVAIRTQPKPVDPPVLPEWTLSNFAGLADKTYVSLGWKTSEYATSGRVRWGLSETSLTNEVVEGAAVVDHAVLISGLTPDTLYYFQATSTDDQGQVKSSAVIAVRTMAEDPIDPPVIPDWNLVGFDATTTPTSSDLIWTTPGAETKATIRVGLSPTNLTLMEVAVDDYADTHLVTVTGLSPQTQYYLQVIAVDRSGRTQESIVIMKRTKAQ